MRNIKMKLMYDGGGFRGWQRLGSQDTAPSVQGYLEELLSGLLEEEIKVIGSGRTDAGVHAQEQIANFHTKSTVPLSQLKQLLDQILKESIKVTELEEVKDSFHSRYDAVSKTYEYCIDTGEKPRVFTRKYAASVPCEPNLEQMERAAGYLTGRHDFAGFSSQKGCPSVKQRPFAKGGNKNTIREIYRIEIFFTGRMLHIIINGNGFLYNMVRIIAGTLLEVGTGKRKPEDMTAILEKRDRQLAGPTMDSQGLFLKQVYYKEEDLH